MKTTTILNAYIKARDKRFALNAPHKRFRQCNTFHATLLRRIYDGDQAREALKVFADIWYPVDILEESES